MHTSICFSQGQQSSTPAPSQSLLENSSLQQAPQLTGISTGLGAECDMIYATIKSSTSESGMSKSTIKQLLAGKLAPEKVE